MSEQGSEQAGSSQPGNESRPVLEYATVEKRPRSAAYLSFRAGIIAWVGVIACIAFGITLDSWFAPALAGMGFLTWIIWSVVAIVLGHVGMSEAQNSGARDTHFAIAGLWLGWITAGLIIVTLLYEVTLFVYLGCFV
jgi:hypothetical protein